MQRPLYTQFLKFRCSLPPAHPARFLFLERNFVGSAPIDLVCTFKDAEERKNYTIRMGPVTFLKPHLKNWLFLRPVDYPSGLKRIRQRNRRLKYDET